MPHHKQTALLLPSGIILVLCAGSAFAQATDAVGSPAVEAVTLASCCGAPCTPAPSDLICWWRGDFDARDIVGGHNGTLQSGATYEPGMVGQAFSFDGTGAVNIPNTGNLNVQTSDFTVDAWVRFTDSLVTGEAAVIFQSYGGTPAYGLAIDDNNHVYLGFRDNSGNSVAAISTTRLNDGLWHFVAGVRERSTARIYVDGIEENSAPHSVGSIDNTCQTVHIGGTSTGTSACNSGSADEAFFTGQIDELEIFQRALTPLEILRIRDAGCAGKCLTPALSPAKVLNASARLLVGTGANVLIGGFVITGNAPKLLALRGLGPSLSASGISNPLADPILELHDSSPTAPPSNDNWEDDPVTAAELRARGLAPSNSLESGLVVMLPPCASYTAILAGKNGGTGVGLLEVYDLNPQVESEIANFSARGFVQTGGDVIGGFILGGNSNNTRVALRGMGPSLALLPFLGDPTLQLHGPGSFVTIMNDNWPLPSNGAAAVEFPLRGLVPLPLESGILTSLSPVAFTAILAGGTGIGRVEIYNVH
jgi:Concanavalin A-like lectin/glucanases superfamily